MGNFYFFATFKSYDYFSEENISRHGFLEEVLRWHNDVDHVLPWLLTAFLFTHAKEKASEASAKYAGMGFTREVSNKNREAVNIFVKKWTY